MKNKLILIVTLSIGILLGRFILISNTNPSIAIHPNKTTSKKVSTIVGEQQLWTCGMHPQVISDKPGKCPICHMDLVPLKSDIPASSTKSVEERVAITIDPTIVQNMGIRTTLVKALPLKLSARLIGTVEEAQPNIRDVNLRVSGWIQKLYANVEGMPVKEGQALFDIYSPELLVAIDELIAAKQTNGSPRSLYDTAVRKLIFLGMSSAQIEVFTKLSKAPQTVSILSPISGEVTEKIVVEGAAVKSGDKALRIVDHSTLWIDAQAYEQQLPFIKIGQTVTAAVDSFPQKLFSGKIVFIHPHLDPTTRTAKVRISISNDDLLLKPGMYAVVHLERTLEDNTIQVPREAIIDTGLEQKVFTTDNNGHFTPRNVRVGLVGDNSMVQILEGLSPGDVVVTSGQFLLDSESRTQEAIQKFLNEKGQINTPNRPGINSPTQHIHGGS